MEEMIKKNCRVLFQGDSITDAGRIYEDGSDLGRGYPVMIASLLNSFYPEKNVEFINRGISGDTVKYLDARWQKDCIEIKPDLLSILIGINDCWRRYDTNDPMSVETFENTYRKILTDVKENTDAKLVIMEPFLLPVFKYQEEWREDLDPKIHAVRRLAREFDAIFIPLDGIFAQAVTLREPTFWSADGVHPTLSGHALIARSWLDTLRTSIFR